MSWQLVLFFLLGGLVCLMGVGVPVAFAFLTVNIVGAIVVMGGFGGLQMLVLSTYDALTTFVYAPIPLFILMGAIMYHTGGVKRSLNAIDMCMGQLPGRLSLLAIGSGTLFASLSGSSMANTALLGSALVPEMHRRGYSNQLSLGPILASGSLAIMIPPSSLAVLLGSIANISIASILIGGILPGLFMAALYAAYVIGTAWLRPELAPAYELVSIPLKSKVTAVLRDVVPLGFIIFLVIGVILLGWATPTESAALGAVGTAVLAVVYRDLTWSNLRISLLEATEVTVMVFWIIGGATFFSQLLAFSGAGPGLVQFVGELAVEPIYVILACMLLFLFLGCFMEQLSILMITIPILMPIVEALGIDTLWFAILVLITLEVAAISPPFGLVLFVMKGVAPPNVTMTDIYKSVVPFIVCNIVVLAMMIMIPSLALWLPSLQG